MAIPPDYEPGARGSYSIVGACIIENEQVFHMELSGIVYSHRHGCNMPFQTAAVIHSPLGHAPDSSGTYRILDKDLTKRECILDIGCDTGGRMNMTWRIDSRASESVFNWEEWP